MSVVRHPRPGMLSLLLIEFPLNTHAKMLSAPLSHPSQQSWPDGRSRITTGANGVGGSTIAIRCDKSKHKFAAFPNIPAPVAEIVGELYTSSH